jgi:hypothetical protein
MLLVGDRLAAQLHLRSGGVLAVKGRAYRIAGIYHSGILFENSGAVLAIAEARRLTSRPGEETSVVAELAPGRRAAAVAPAIEHSFPGTQVITDPEQALRAAPTAR